MLPTAVEVSDQQIHFSFFGNTAQKSEMLAVRRKAGAGVDIANQLLRRSAQNRNPEQETEQRIILAGTCVIHIVAVRRKCQPIELAHIRRNDLNVAARSYLTHHQALFFAISQNVNDVLAVRRDGNTGSLAAPREPSDFHVLKVQGCLAFAECEISDNRANCEYQHGGGNTQEKAFAAFLPDSNSGGTRPLAADPTAAEGAPEDAEGIAEAEEGTDATRSDNADGAAFSRSDRGTRPELVSRCSRFRSVYMSDAC